MLYVIWFAGAVVLYGGFAVAWLRWDRLKTNPARHVLGWFCVVLAAMWAMLLVVRLAFL
jgi:hypothetical protein